MSSSVAASNFERSGGDPERRLELGPHGSRGGDADLLADDGAKQGLRAGLARPRLGNAILLDDPGEGRLAAGKLGEVDADALAGPNHQREVAA